MSQRPFVYLGITVGLLVGVETQERYDAYRSRRASRRRVEALRAATTEQAVREEAARQGVDIESVLAAVQAGRQPDVDQQDIVKVLLAAMGSVSKPEARRAIETLLGDHDG